MARPLQMKLLWPIYFISPPCFDDFHPQLGIPDGLQLPNRGDGLPCIGILAPSPDFRLPSFCMSCTKKLLPATSGLIREMPSS